MKSSVPDTHATVPSSDVPIPYVTDAARKRLDTLRGAVDLRLAALESALRDPERGESLEGIILDLSRVATEEAHATAVLACEDNRLASETRIAETKMAAQAAIEHERAMAAAIITQERTAAQTAIAQEREAAQSSIEQEWRAARALAEKELAAAHTLVEKERLAAQTLVEQERAAARTLIDQERATAMALVDRERAEGQARVERERLEMRAKANTEVVAATQRTEAAEGALAKERTTNGELAEALEQARQRIGELDQALRDSTGSLQQLRASAAQEQREHAETRAQLAVERSSVTELRTTAARSSEQLAALGRQEADAKMASADILADLERAQQAQATLHEALAAAQSSLDEERTAAADLRRGLAHAEARLTEAIASEHEARVELRNGTTRLEEQVQAAVEAERASTAGLRDSATRSQEALSSLGQQASATRAAHDQLKTALDAERRKSRTLELARDEALRTVEHATRDAAHQLATLKEMHASRAAEAAADAQVVLDRLRSEAESTLERERLSAQARMEAERGTVAELRNALEAANHQLSVLVDAKDQTQMGAAETQEALAYSRNEVRALRDELEAARTRIERLAGEQADAERNWKQAEGRLTLMTRERDTLAEQAKTSTKRDSAHGLKSVGTKAHSPEPPPRGRKSAEKLSEPAGDGNSKKDEAEWATVRMSPRYRFKQPIEVQINGGMSTLVDLSFGGCQLLSTASLKPNQSVKLSIAHDPKPIACVGKVIWANLEAPAQGRPSGYRAGIEFTRADEAALEALIARHGSST